MNQNRNIAYLDFPDEQRSLSFDSFCENGKQTIERPTPAAGMCICAELAKAGKLSISWNQVLHKQLDLPAGSHKLMLDENIPSGEGELTLAVLAGNEAGEERTYLLVSDYGKQYFEFQFRLYAERRESQRLARLQAQCPAPGDGQSLASLKAEKYEAAVREVELMHRVLGNLHAIDISHMIHITLSLGDSAGRRLLIDNALNNLRNQMRIALQGLDKIELNLEHVRYYSDQAPAAKQ